MKVSLNSSVEGGCTLSSPHYYKYHVILLQLEAKKGGGEGRHQTNHMARLYKGIHDIPIKHHLFKQDR